jgi:hypothetical protein
MNIMRRCVAAVLLVNGAQSASGASGSAMPTRLLVHRTILAVG